MDTTANELYTVPQAAKELGLTRRGVLFRLTAGTMQGIKVSPKLWLIPAAEVDRWRELGKARQGRPRKDADGATGS